MRARVLLILVGSALVGSAILARVWLASTGAYTGGPLSIPLRVASTISLGAGFLLAGAAVAWPVRTRKGSPGPADGPEGRP